MTVYALLLTRHITGYRPGDLACGSAQPSPQLLLKPGLKADVLVAALPLHEMCSILQVSRHASSDTHLQHCANAACTGKDHTAQLPHLLQCLAGAHLTERQAKGTPEWQACSTPEWQAHPDSERQAPPTPERQARSASERPAQASPPPGAAVPCTVGAGAALPGCFTLDLGPGALSSHRLRWGSATSDCDCEDPDWAWEVGRKAGVTAGSERCEFTGGWDDLDLGPGALPSRRLRWSSGAHCCSFVHPSFSFQDLSYRSLKRCRCLPLSCLSLCEQLGCSGEARSRTSSVRGPAAGRYCFLSSPAHFRKCHVPYH